MSRVVSSSFRNTLNSFLAERYMLFNRFVGIVHHVFSPHTHQQNGAVETKHRHIVDMELALLAQSSMPIRFWDEAFLIATYLINRLSSRDINNSTPISCLLNTNPDYSIMKTFGCACWPNLSHIISGNCRFVQSSVCS